MTKQALGAEIGQLAEDAVLSGEVPALQIAVAQDGVVVWSGAWGTAGPAQVFHAYSAGKPVLALALSVALERNEIPWSAPVRRFLPFLEGEGMGEVTLAHLANHHAGLANAPLPLAEAGHRGERVARMASWSPRHASGERFAYHAESAWWLLAAVLEQLSGESAALSVVGLLRELGLGERAGLIPMPEWEDAIVSPVLVGEHGAYLPQDAKSVAYRAAYDAHLLHLASPENRVLGVPGSGYLSTACELALFYQQLLRALDDGHPSLPRACVEAMIQVDHPASFDSSTGAAAMRGRGLVIAGDEQRYLRGFPPTVSAQAFGHTGAGGQFAWADPATGLSFALLSSGLERDAFKMGVRGARIGTAALNTFTPALSSAMP